MFLLSVSLEKGSSHNKRQLSTLYVDMWGMQGIREKKQKEHP